MGTTQSSSSSSSTVDPAVAPSSSLNDESKNEPAANFSTKQYAVSKEDFKNKPNLSGMALVNYKCRKKKKIYDRCVSNFYKEFITSPKSLDQEEVCGEKFEAYRTCVLRGIKKEIWDKNKQGLPPKEGSILSELDDEE